MRVGVAAVLGALLVGGTVAAAEKPEDTPKQLDAVFLSVESAAARSDFVGANQAVAEAMKSEDLASFKGTLTALAPVCHIMRDVDKRRAAHIAEVLKGRKGRVVRLETSAGDRQGKISFATAAAVVLERKVVADGKLTNATISVPIRTLTGKTLARYRAEWTPRTADEAIAAAVIALAAENAESMEGFLKLAKGHALHDYYATRLARLASTADSEPKPTPKSKVPTATALTIEALVDGKCELHITPQGIFWQSVTGMKPGYAIGKEPTYVNGNAWQPEWTDSNKVVGPDKSKMHPITVAPVRDLKVELLAVGSRRGAAGVEKRGQITFRQKHKLSVLTIPDPEPGARWYTIRIYGPAATSSLRKGLLVYLPFNRSLRDESGNKHKVDDHGNVRKTRNRSGRAARAALLDGKNSYVQIVAANDLDFTGSFSVCAWVRPAPGAHVQSIVRQGNFAQSKYRFGLKYHADKKFAFSLHRGTWTHAVSKALIKFGRWYHVAGVYEHNTRKMTLYVDGRPAATAVHRPGLNPAKDQSVFVGAEDYRGRGKFLTGALDNVLLYDRALPEREIRKLMELE